MSEPGELIRTQPHSDEAEHAVIGCLLLDNAQAERCMTALSAEDFYHPQHRAMWSTITALIAASKPADVVTVAEAGGHDMAYLNGMAASVMTPKHAPAYAALVRQHAVRRECMRVAMDLADDAMRGTGECVTLIEAAVAKLLALQGGAVSQSPRTVADLLPTFIDRLQARANGENDSLATGLRDVDRLLSGGFRPGELVVIGARPSMGKSSLVGNIARSMAVQSVVLFCSMEDSGQMLLARQVAAAGRVNLADIRRPDHAPESMWTGVAQAADELLPLNLHIDDQPALTLADVKRKMGQVKHRAGRLHVVIVDYAQLMDGEGDNRHQTLSAIAAGLKAAAKSYGVVVILLSQLNREADKLNGPPRLEHLRESGGIEEAADIVALLWREHRRNPKPDNKHSAQLEFVKHKNGATDTVRLWFDGATQRFDNFASESHHGD